MIMITMPSAQRSGAPRQNKKRPMRCVLVSGCCVGREDQVTEVLTSSEADMESVSVLPLSARYNIYVYNTGMMCMYIMTVSYICICI